MSPQAQLPLASLEPGGLFLLVLAGLIAVAIAVRALVTRLLGGDRYDRWTGILEGTIFCLFLGVMLAISGLQVIMRNFFRTGVLWFDPLVRTLVLWVAFLGALTATSHARHLHIDVLRRSLPEKIRRPVSRALSTLAAVCCALLANGSYAYLREEYHHAMSPFLGVPSWAAQSILLWGFGLLAYRFLVQAIWPSPERLEPELTSEREG